ncbi:Membrane-bound lytic murein transglycosylase A precursor [Thalassovita gelatinovora]|uniref:peptidoglycan lytic exotransglycosylase n=1 Tax=Thalassovita gelatinovora TaxID=53501 RepID=A0A0P1F9X7_THAGE|nr:MltA domain-containing protein [Thalassovita gelatinovora]QIZ81046.1 murein transglycosylase [Thalassovita gelatinovora]CUH65004.1 Membrane-bound lytic murein transglycosylase A precursor [Thalassovita gelatinovora]SEP88100.1 membrane-bound lytic murein transglycosylase A [Thalassovita gelatinovora]
MIRRLAAAVLAGVLMTGAAQSDDLTYQILDFEVLDGWKDDDHATALSVFLNTCTDLNGPDWQSLCAVAQNIENPRAFFELFFRPVLIKNGSKALFTGYFEPELDGSQVRTDRFRYPLYRMPSEAKAGSAWLSRRDIENSGVMEGRGLEIAWVDDPVELFFLQIQGSGRIRLPNGHHLRVGYGGSNGHDYRSVGVEMIRRGIYQQHQVSAQVIKSWVRRNLEDGLELLRHNPSYVFFRLVDKVSPEDGPLGAMNRSVTGGRSIAVDPVYTPLGAPVWVEKDGENPLRRLMVAQDTGSAIKGPQRADIFFGTGDAAGRAAGRLRDPGRMLVLLPIQRAYALLPENEQ